MVRFRLFNYLTYRSLFCRSYMAYFLIWTNSLLSLGLVGFQRNT
jgi:hypothetical protein